MMLRVTAPETVPGERVRVCCTACRRGTKAMGVLPCGMALNCRCHEAVAEPWEVA